MATKLSQIFSSKTRVEILECLYYAKCGLGIRKIADLCDLHVHSVEVTLKQLYEEKLVLRNKKGNQILYLLNAKSDNCLLLKSIFLASEIFRIQKCNIKFFGEGLEVLKFITVSQKMLDKARRSYLGS